MNIGKISYTNIGKISSTIERGIHRVTEGVNWIALVVLCLIVLLVTSDAFGRFIFNRPITGAMEIDELLMVILVFLTMAYCSLKGAHIKVDLLVSHISKRTEAILNCFTSLISLFIYALIVWQLGSRGLWGILLPGGRVSSVLGIPDAPFVLLAALGGALLCLELAIFFFHSLAVVIHMKAR